MGQFERKYGVAATITVPLFKIGTTTYAGTGDWTPVTGDVKVSKNAGNVANIATLPVAVGGTGSKLWKFVLSATEAQAEEIVIQIVDAALEDDSISVSTYGNASAQHAFDRDTALVTLAAVTHTGAVIPTVTTLTGHTAQTGDSFGRIGAAGVSLTNLGGMSAGMKAEVQVEADASLASYDGPTNAEMIARTILAASYFDPAADAVANVTLVATTTTNSDMRGTDAAFLATNAPTNFKDLAITVTTGRITVGTIVADAVDAASLKADAVNKIADGYLDRTDGIETGLTPRQGLRIAFAADGGVVAGADTTTVTLKNKAGTKTRMSATVDVDGNRGPVVFDLT